MKHRTDTPKVPHEKTNEENPQTIPAKTMTGEELLEMIKSKQPKKVEDTPQGSQDQ